MRLHALQTRYEDERIHGDPDPKPLGKGCSIAFVAVLVAIAIYLFIKRNDPNNP